MYDVSQYVGYQEEKCRRRQDRLNAIRLKALGEAEALARVIGERFQPLRVYVFNSVLDPDLFAEYSDLDMAITGLSGPSFYDAFAIAEDMSSLSLDWVNMDRVPDFIYERIVRTGKVLYERQQGSTTVA